MSHLCNGIPKYSFPLHLHYDECPLVFYFELHSETVTTIKYITIYKQIILSSQNQPSA